MKPLHALFLQALQAALQNRQVAWDTEVTALQYAQMLELAENHHILPLFFESTYTTAPAAALAPDIVARCRQSVLHAVVAQSIRTENLLALLRQLQQQGHRVLVVKGAICRNLYPQADRRTSSDEDLLCIPDQFPAFHKALLAQGFTTNANLDDYEVPYTRPDGGLYVELHKHLFPPESDVLGSYNDLFADAFQQAVTVSINGQPVPTLCSTDHFLYLLIHAYKHFLHSGFGIRQVCDITLFANAYGSEIDWNRIVSACQRLRAHKFAVAVLRIGEKYLTFDPEKACLPHHWANMSVDELPLLEDLLAGGVYGSADRSRMHSGNMTLGAVRANQQGKRPGLGRTFFPPASQLAGRYPYLQTKPFLLPVAWTQRLISFGKETRHRVTDPGKAIQVGNQRIRLLQKYDIID